MFLFFTIPTQSSEERWEWMMSHLTNEQIRALYHEAYRIVKNREDAEDVIQEALVIGATKCGQLRNKEKLFSWMFSIVRHEAFAYHRHFYLRDLYSKAKLKLIAPVSAKSAEQESLRAHELEILRNAIDCLKSPAKEIIRMKLYEDKSLFDIAKLLNMNYNTVRSRYQRTLIELKRIMEDPNHE